MGDTSKISTMILYAAFYVGLILMIAAEMFIAFHTHQKNPESNKADKSDKGTKWLLIFNFYICVYISFFMIGDIVPKSISKIKLPFVLSYVGVILMFAGVIIRLIAVFTLKNAFTLGVQTTSTQHLITTGIYHKVRNPAYTGSIVSLIGTSMALRSIIAVTITVVLSLFSYYKRISVEEKALKKCFGEEFLEYEKNTYRLFPYIW